MSKILEIKFIYKIKNWKFKNSVIKAYDTFIKLAIKNRPKSTEAFLALKKEISKKLGIQIPTNADLRETYNKLVKQKMVSKNPEFEKIMLSRRIRTRSGVAVVAVLTKPYPCPGKCIYCPNEKGMPKSYLSNEPAVMRAIASKFDPYMQVWSRLRSLELNGHETDKIELIVMGGTFSFLPKDYQKWFIKECFRAANKFSPFVKGGLKGDFKNQIKLTNPSQSPFSKVRGGYLGKLLLKEQSRNEEAKHRIVGLTLETRPDFIDEVEINNFRELGCTRVELGVQSVFDDVLKLNKRGHKVGQTIKATKLLKDAGFKINYHIMPGLPGSTLKKDYEMFRQLFNNPDFQPDMLKIYPTIVVKNSALYNMWKKSKKSIIHYTPIGAKCIMRKLLNYKPLTDKQFEKLILKVKNEIIPPYVRISRLVRDVPATSIIDGPRISNLRQLIAARSQCQCIRCREVGADYNIKELMVLNRINYEASDGTEIFLQYVSRDKKKLFALLRLRIPSPLCHPEHPPARFAARRAGEAGSEGSRANIANNNSSGFFANAQNDNLFDLFPILKNAALIREVHTYGKLKSINTKGKKSLPASIREALQAGPQHIGLGKKLMQEAERIVKVEFGLNKIVVIAGVGVRGYYRKMGYRQKETYMVKNI